MKCVAVCSIRRGDNKFKLVAVAAVSKLCVVQIKPITHRRARTHTHKRAHIYDYSDRVSSVNFFVCNVHPADRPSVRASVHLKIIIFLLQFINAILWAVFGFDCFYDLLNLLSVCEWECLHLSPSRPHSLRIGFENHKVTLTHSTPQEWIRLCHWYHHQFNMHKIDICAENYIRFGIHTLFVRRFISFFFFCSFFCSLARSHNERYNK